MIVSGSVGARVIMLDASQILLADDGGLRVDVSTSATVQMDSSPADPTVAGTVLISLFPAEPDRPEDHPHGLLEARRDVGGLLHFRGGVCLMRSDYLARRQA